MTMVMSLNYETEYFQCRAFTSQGPKGFSPEFSDFLRQCLHKDPDNRLPAEVLLGSPWLIMHGATSPEIATENVHNWIRNITGSG